ncbi:MAG: cell division protein ZapA [Bauldia sp.]
MPSVPVTINGKTFRMACDEGEEQRLLSLADEVNAKIERFRGTFGEIGDLRLIVMAAIELADDLDGARRRLERVETEAAAARARDAVQAGRQQGVEGELARAVAKAADRITDIARRLNAVD